MSKLRLSVCFCVFIFTLLSCHGHADDEDGTAFLLYCDHDIRNFSLALPHRDSAVITRIPVRPRVIDYHVKKKLLFWTDYGDNINKAPLWEARARPSVLRDLSGSFGLAVDWLHDLLYWTDRKDKQVKVAMLDGTLATTVLKEEGIEPFAVVLNPAEGTMFWSDHGTIRKIERCNMDGSDRKVIVKDDIHMPESLAIDLGSRRIFWVDTHIDKNYLSSSKFDGNRRRNLLTGLKRPISVDVYGHYVYFVTFDSGHQAVYQASKEDGSGIKKVLDGEIKLRSLKIFDPSKQSEGFNVCGNNNGGCSHLCLPTSAHTFSCACPNTLLKRSDNITCMDSNGFPVTTPRSTTYSTSTHLPVKDFQINVSSSTEENENQNSDATGASSGTHATLAIIMASLALIAMVGMLLYFRMFLLKNVAITDMANPVYNKNAEENLYI
ncbi:hypothetical protein JTE90_026349 [Oedothorax gibbosus]|uniref:Uncharacterized protein n=1 Tax=Oedothorax gibbosus TaxID=931172 RepID=A0AAV6ULJ1_9ARAC|nr:hypothetical protein JTE90_026349 [Oedothorax gibbosus]